MAPLDYIKQIEALTYYPALPVALLEHGAWQHHSDEEQSLNTHPTRSKWGAHNLVQLMSSTSSTTLPGNTDYDPAQPEVNAEPI